MINFEFYNPARIVFGKGVEDQVGALVKRHGTKALLHYGGGSIKKTGVYDKVVDSLNAAGVPFVELGGVKPGRVQQFLKSLIFIHQGFCDKALSV